MSGNRRGYDVSNSYTKDLTRWAEMLRCTQHDNAAVYELMRIFADSSAHNKGSHALML